MVADLLEVGEQGQDAAAALDARGGLQVLVHLLHPGLVEEGLLLGELGVDLHLLLVGQVLDDGAVGLRARRRMKGPTRWRSSRAASGSRYFSMGEANWSLNWLSLPR